MNSTDISSYVTVQQAAKMIKLSFSRIRKKIKQGHYDALKIGKIWLIPAIQVIKEDRRFKKEKEKHNEDR